MIRDLPQFLVNLLNECPPAGTGVHIWLFKACRQLHPHFKSREIFDLLKERVKGCGRVVPDSEIWDTIKNSAECAWQPKGSTSPVTTAKWPDLNKERRAAIIRDGFGLPDLWELGNPRIEDNGQHTEMIIDRLFPGNPLLCCGKSNSDFDTKPRESWRGELATLALIVPSAMTAPTGLTKNGKESAHALSITGPRRFLVCEFDSGSMDEHAALLLHLGQSSVAWRQLHRQSG